MDETPAVASPRDYLERYLREAPLATALWRSAEAVALSEVALPRPILDVGCGFGEFARLFFEGQPPPETGIDIDRGELHRARAGRSHRHLLQCDARHLPLRDADFASAIAISTLEHIPDVAPAFGEVLRVVRPGGVFAFTVPIDAFDRNMLGHRVLGVASSGLARSYAGMANRLLTHVNIWPAERWLEIVRDAGFTIERSSMMMAPRGTAAFELLLPAALASRAWRKVTGRRPPHPAFAVRAASRAMLPLVTDRPADGSNLLVVARRPL